jgi:hypothetical protein
MPAVTRPDVSYSEVRSSISHQIRRLGALAASNGGNAPETDRLASSAAELLADANIRLAACEGFGVPDPD